jgi:hypothetical protein
LRGGSTLEDISANEQDEDKDENEVDKDEEDEEKVVEEVNEDNVGEEISKEESKSFSTDEVKPVRLVCSTNLGNSLIDQKIELTPRRTRTIAEIKKNLSKQLPGKPPVRTLELVYEGRALSDEMLVDELFEDADEEDDDGEDRDEAEDEITRTVILNIVPPVNPKFLVELAPKLKAGADGDEKDQIGTEELIDAYFLNQVAVSRNMQLLTSPNMKLPPSMRLEMEEEAKQLKEQLRLQTPSDKWEKSLRYTQKDAAESKAQWKGERYRSGKGGLTIQMKKSLQTNFNVVSSLFLC